ncbi:hypothetical protein [Sulfitobacter faviae]|uniref:hypothetical protein n=1 Tax=Sulfitobacter faviae TaxID=1775881 RepID=UPI002456E540|nr:hypothetical protein [Sulfitobacter faviae]
MTSTHFTPRTVIDLALKEAPENNARAQIDPCAGTAAFSIMATAQAVAPQKDAINA